MSKNKYVANFLKTRTGRKQPAPTSKVQPQPTAEEVARRILVPEDPTGEVSRGVIAEAKAAAAKTTAPKASTPKPSQQPKG